MTEAIVFVIITLALAFASRASLLKPRSHGFYRFIAWEFMALMFVMNWSIRSQWDISFPHWTIAHGLFLISLFLVFSGFGPLLRSGKPDPKRVDAPMMGFEKTTVLVTHGLYRYIRHPIYASLIFLCWGFFFEQPSLASGICGIIATLFLIATARVEERENINYFGDSYRDYMKRSKMFIPFIL
jgi:protein-S-isoprenylcysteine O-methyltransferase Ste14